jgi:hypothetical protein
MFAAQAAPSSGGDRTSLGNQLIHETPIEAESSVTERSRSLRREVSGEKCPQRRRLMRNKVTAAGPVGGAR